MVERNAKEYTKLARAFENEEWDVVSDTAAGKDFTDVGQDLLQNEEQWLTQGRTAILACSSKSSARSRGGGFSNCRRRTRR
jgi:hypothetical protein